MALETRISQLACVTAIACGLSLPASAEQSVTVTFISGYPPAATFVGGFVDGYVQAVDAALAKTGKYKINWVLAHSGQVAKPRGELEAIQGGLGDIGPTIPPFHFDKVPLYKMPYVTPFTTNDVKVLSATLQNLERTIPEYEKTWASLNQKSLIVTSNVDNYVLASKKRVTKFADLKGMKIGGAGANLPWISAAGGTGVSTTLPDMYNSLNTGIYEATIAWPQALGSFKLCEPAPYMLDASFGANSMLTLTVNLDSWKKWPDELRGALAAAAPVYDERQIQLLLEGDKAGIEKCQAQHKLTIDKLSPADVKAWAMALPPLALEWAKEMDDKGQPGTKVLRAYMDAMRAAKQPVYRDWDKQ